MPSGGCACSSSLVHMAQGMPNAVLSGSDPHITANGVRAVMDSYTALTATRRRPYTPVRRFSMHFSKMHGLGNDFIVVDCISQPNLEDAAVKAAPQLCDRHFGV